MNLISHKPHLYVVVGPLVRLLQTDTSWTDKAEIAAAIGSCFRHWSDMEAEARHLNQQRPEFQKFVDEHCTDNPG